MLALSPISQIIFLYFSIITVLLLRYSLCTNFSWPCFDQVKKWGLVRTVPDNTLHSRPCFLCFLSYFKALNIFNSRNTKNETSGLIFTRLNQQMFQMRLALFGNDFKFNRANFFLRKLSSIQRIPLAVRLLRVWFNNCYCCNKHSQETCCERKNDLFNRAVTRLQNKTRQVSSAEGASR